MQGVGLPPTKVSFMESGGFPIAWIQWLSDLAGIVNGLQKEGPTARRPVAVPYLGFFYYDTTLGKPIWAKTQAPATWVDATGAPV